MHFQKVTNYEPNLKFSAHISKFSLWKGALKGATSFVSWGLKDVWGSSEAQANAG